MVVFTHSLALFLWLFFLAACTGATAAEIIPAPADSAVPETTSESTLPQADEAASAACPLTEPVWVKPPDDSAVLTPPEFGYYFVNADRSIWASAWFTEEYPLRAGEDGNKMGWFRPAGATLEITGRRIDASPSSRKSRMAIVPKSVASPTT